MYVMYVYEQLHYLRDIVVCSELKTSRLINGYLRSLPVNISTLGTVPFPFGSDSNYVYSHRYGNNSFGGSTFNRNEVH